jgi:hypothetical protein
MPSKIKCAVKPAKVDRDKIEIHGRAPTLNYDILRSQLEHLECKPSEGVKHDGGKRQWALLPWREVGLVADVMTLGARKYSADNWMHVPAAERRYFEAAMRHITARQAGEIHDPETKKPHLAHAICCLLFWMWFDNKNKRGHK